METTKAMLETLIQTIGDNYAGALEKLPMKKSVRECLIEGFRAGVREGVTHTVGMLDVKVNE